MRWKDAKARQAGRHRRGAGTDRIAGPGGGRVLIYGLHAVEAAMGNPSRTVHQLFATENAERRLAAAIAARRLAVQRVAPAALDRLLGADTVHQGVALEASALPDLGLDDLAGRRLVLVLDQVTDPHNLGAILRSAAAFAVDAVVVTARNSPPLAGSLAKAASGGLEHVPVIRIPNLARALSRLGELGFDRIGLDGEAESRLEDMTVSPPVALVLGAEGKGLRRLTRETCDRLCRLTTSGPIASLNVSNAAAVALHCVVTSPGWRGPSAAAPAAKP